MTADMADDLEPMVPRREPKKTWRCECGVRYPQGEYHVCLSEVHMKQKQQRETARQEAEAGQEHYLPEVVKARQERAARQETEALLDERETTHGSFAQNSLYGQMLRAIFRGSPGWLLADERQREALDYLAGKFSRILSGQPGHPGHWEDIAGYATLATHPEKQR